jgi:hypothetical protein
MSVKSFFEQNRGAFFSDRDAAVAYVKANCRDEFASVLLTADAAVEQKFVFQLRWDMEQTTVPVVFDGPIDWLRQPGDDPEFAYAFNRMPFWVCMGQAYAMTGDEKYAKAFAGQLVHWVDTVRRDDSACQKAWRTIEAGFRMDYWGKAMCYFEGSPHITEEVMDKFAASMTDHAEYIMDNWNSYNLMSNWGVIANRGLFFAGCLLPETERTAEYRREALRRLDAERRIQVYADGVQWEQSPMYHNEVFRCLLEVVLLAHQKGIALPDGMEESVRRMAMVDLAWQKPNGSEPMMGDSDDIDQRDILTLAAAVFRDGVLKSAGYPTMDFDSLWMVGAQAAEEYDTMPAVCPEKTDFALHDSGNYIFRDRWGADGAWVRFHCGMLGAGHGHADQLHIDVSAFGEDVLTDSGRYTYVYGPVRREFKDPTAHNTTTVDGEYFYITADSWECSKLCRAVNRVYCSNARYGYAEGGHLGYYEKGVFVNRRLIFLKPDVLVIADEFYSGDSHDYRQFFHWGETGRVSEESGLIRWDGEKCAARMKQISAVPMQVFQHPGRISRHYNHAQENTVTETVLHGEGFTSVFTVLALDRRGAEERFSAEKLPVYSNFKGIQFLDQQIEALHITKGGRSWAIAVAHEEYASPTDTFNAGGCTGFGGVVVFDEAAGETEIGTVLAR